MSYRLAAVFAACIACGPSTATPTAAPRPASGSVGAAAASCPYSIEHTANQGGTCLEPAVLGEPTIASCKAYFAAHGWQPDEMAESAIGARTGKVVKCFRAPEAATP